MAATPSGPAGRLLEADRDTIVSHANAVGVGPLLARPGVWALSGPGMPTPGNGRPRTVRGAIRPPGSAVGRRQVGIGGTSNADAGRYRCA